MKARKFKIDEWGIINLIENEQQQSHEQEKCKCFNKNKKILAIILKHLFENKFFLYWFHL